MAPTTDWLSLINILPSSSSPCFPPKGSEANDADGRQNRSNGISKCCWCSEPLRDRVVFFVTWRHSLTVSIIACCVLTIYSSWIVSARRQDDLHGTQCDNTSAVTSCMDFMLCRFHFTDFRAVRQWLLFKPQVAVFPRNRFYLWLLLIRQTWVFGCSSQDRGRDDGFPFILFCVLVSSARLILFTHVVSWRWGFNW